MSVPFCGSSAASGCARALFLVLPRALFPFVLVPSDGGQGAGWRTEGNRADKRMRHSPTDKTRKTRRRRRMENNTKRETTTDRHRIGSIRAEHALQKLRVTCAPTQYSCVAPLHANVVSLKMGRTPVTPLHNVMAFPPACLPSFLPSSLTWLVSQALSLLASPSVRPHPRIHTRPRPPSLFPSEMYSTRVTDPPTCTPLRSAAAKEDIQLIAESLLCISREGSH